MYKLIVAAFAALMIVGCTSTPTTDTTAPVEDKSGATTTTPGASTSGAGTGGVTGSQAGTGARSGVNPLRDPSSPLSKRSVFFDFDSFVVKDEYKPTIEAHARWLQQNRGQRMTIQGNTDERGSREYNIALGQKRADAVKRMMTLLGAQDSQIETVSFGKEKPRSNGHDESAWAENRRDDIVYSGE